MSGRSPFQTYNTIRLGIAGTAMQAYPSLTDEEVWDLAFYIHSLRLEKQFPDSISLEQLFEQARSEIPLNDVATLTDNQIIEKLGAHKVNSEIKLRALRLNSNTKVSSENLLKAATDYLTSALANYREGNKKAASQDALAAYFEGVEPSEVAVIILAFAGLWLHNHSKAEKWKTFIKEKIGKQLQGKKMYGLGFFSFLAIILLGKGIHSFQESGWLPVTEVPFSASIDWLGIYPTFESMGAQLILTALVLVLYFSGISKTKTIDNSNIK